MTTPIPMRTRAFGTDLGEDRCDGTVDPREGHHRERRGTPCGQDRQGHLGRRIRQPGRPEVERDHPEADRDSDREAEVGQAEDLRLDRQVTQRARDPGCRCDCERAGDDHGADLPDPDGGSDAGTARDERDQDAEQATDRCRRDRDPGIRKGQRKGCRGQCPEHHGRGVASRPGSCPDEREREAGQAAEHEEEAEEVGRGDRGAADHDRLPGADRQRGDERGSEPGEDDEHGDRRPAAQDQGCARHRRSRSAGTG